MNIAKMLAEKPIDENEERCPPLDEESEYEFPEDSDEPEEDESMVEGEEAAVSEILDAFHAKDTRALRVALKAFVSMCRDAY